MLPSLGCQQIVNNQPLRNSWNVRYVSVKYFNW